MPEEGSVNRNYFIRHEDVAPYHPANHTGTVNRRLIGSETVGHTRIEVLHGTIQPGKGAEPHAHPDIEQVVYMLEGRAVAEIDGVRSEVGPGDCCYFPAGKRHVFQVIGDAPAKLLVIYSPPYEENPDRVIR
jgi:mannose-6-phosphate isomerase-like protein (cupin superfamily)